MNRFDFESLSGLDYILIVILSVGMSYWVLLNSKTKSFPEVMFRPLYLWHLLIMGLALYFNFYQGKEVFRYWQPIIYTYDIWNDWLAHWGFNSYFMEFINYFPGRIFGLHFIVGSLLYSFASFFGFVLISKSIAKVYEEVAQSSKWLFWIFALIFFLPSVHFWSSMPSKESLIWFGLALGIYGFQGKKWLLFFLGVLILIFIRPVLGFIVGFGYWMYFLMFKSGMVYTKVLVSIIILILGKEILEMIQLMMGVESLGWNSIEVFSRNQYEFLSQFDARGNLNMNDFNLVEKLVVVLFRPGFWEIESIWQAAAAIENFFLFIFLFGAIGLVAFGKNGQFSKEFLFVLVLSLVYCLVIGISSYNMGIFMRLKSSVVFGLMISGFYGWFLIIQKFKTVYLNLQSGKI